VLISLATLALVATNAWAVAKRGLSSVAVDLGSTVAMVGLALGAYHLHGALEGATGSSLLGIVVLALIAVGVPGGLLASRRVILL